MAFDPTRFWTTGVGCDTPAVADVSLWVPRSVAATAAEAAPLFEAVGVLVLASGAWLGELEMPPGFAQAPPPPQPAAVEWSTHEPSATIDKLATVIGFDGTRLPGQMAPQSFAIFKGDMSVCTLLLIQLTRSVRGDDPPAIGIGRRADDGFIEGTAEEIQFLSPGEGRA